MPFSPTAHAQRVLSTASLPPASADTPQGLIQRSWQRCMQQYGLDPQRSFDPQVESGGRVRRSRERLEDYLQAARGGMEQLFNHVADLGYMLLLTDSDGVTIDYIGNDALGLDARKIGLYLGANWQESIAGTNGVGTCIAERRALTCHRDDHFYVGNVPLSCTTAPLFHPDGKLMGVLDVSTLAVPNARDSQHLALHLTSLYARMIDDANFTRHFRDHWILRVAANWALVDVRGDMLIAFDQEGCVVGASTVARRWLQGNGSEVMGRRLTEIFDCSMDELWRLTRSSESMDRALLSHVDKQRYFVSVIVARKRMPARVDATPEPAVSPAIGRLAGEDRQMRATQQQAQRLTNKRINLLIHGETGSGKEVFARAIHEASERRRQPFVAVNCAAIPESLIESELFGYTAGTFTGARSRGMKGLIVQADGGTLFLDEIGDMPLHLQTRLLRVLSEHEVLPLGGEKPLSVDLTVIAASHRDLRQRIHDGSFREDLYYRLAGATLRLPALREREDLDYLVDLILREETGQAEAGISPAAMDLLRAHRWPGNVRELRNAMRFALALSDGGDIYADHLPPELRATSVAREALEAPAIEGRLGAEELRLSLQRHRWNISAVAAEAGLARTTIYRQMKRFGIVSPLDSLPG